MVQRLVSPPLICLSVALAHQRFLHPTLPYRHFLTAFSHSPHSPVDECLSSSGVTTYISCFTDRALIAFAAPAVELPQTSTRRPLIYPRVSIYEYTRGLSGLISSRPNAQLRVAGRSVGAPCEIRTHLDLFGRQAHGHYVNGALAAPEGFEPSTTRLTAGRSTAELQSTVSSVSCPMIILYTFLTVMYFTQL